MGGLKTGNYPSGKALIRTAIELVNRNEDRVANEVVLTDSDGNQYLFDLVTGSLVSIDFAHHEVHEGEHFEYINAQDLTNAQTISFTIVAPAGTRWSHFGYELDGESEYDIQLFRGANGLTSAGTPVTNPAVINSNHNSVTANTLIVNSSPTLGAGSKGTLIHHLHRGSGRAMGGIAGSGEEDILKVNTTYWLDIINATATNNYISWIMSWYEHISSFA